MSKISRIATLSLLVALMIITQTACSSEVSPVSKDNYFLDTTCNIAVYEGENPEEAIDAAYKLCAQLDKTLSRTFEGSDISKINSAGGAWVEVSDYTIELLEKGLYYSELSDGKFDITCGGITTKWDFHSEEPVLPSADELAEATRHIGYKNVQIDGNKVRLLDPEAMIDLGGIAKGYIGDKMVEVLEEQGVTSGIVNLGGNIICIGSKPGKDGFSIGVEAPFSDRTEIVGSTVVSDSTLVTSGVYERMFEIDGKIYHHILSTETGWPAETDLDSVTLVAGKGHSVDCDAMSTICLIKGYEGAKEFIESMDGVEAVFILQDGSVEMTSGMEFDKE